MNFLGKLKTNFQNLKRMFAYSDVDPYEEVDIVDPKLEEKKEKEKAYDNVKKLESLTKNYTAEIWELKEYNLHNFFIIDTLRLYEEVYAIVTTVTTISRFNETKSFFEKVFSILGKDLGFYILCMKKGIAMIIEKIKKEKVVMKVVPFFVDLTRETLGSFRDEGAPANGLGYNFRGHILPGIIEGSVNSDFYSLFVYCLTLIPDGVTYDDINISAPYLFNKNTELKYFTALLKNGLDVNAKEPKKGNTLLHQAHLYGNTSLISLLLKKGASPKIKNNDGFLPEELIGMDRCEVNFSMIYGDSIISINTQDLVRHLNYCGFDSSQLNQKEKCSLFQSVTLSFAYAYESRKVALSYSSDIINSIRFYAGNGFYAINGLMKYSPDFAKRIKYNYPITKLLKNFCETSELNFDCSVLTEKEIERIILFAISKIYEAFELQPRLENDIFVFRGEMRDDDSSLTREKFTEKTPSPDDYTEGENLSIKNFLSSSFSPITANKFAGRGGRFYAIKIKKGTKILPMSGIYTNGKEKEIIIHPETKFKFIKKFTLIDTKDKMGIMLESI